MRACALTLLTGGGSGVERGGGDGVCKSGVFMGWSMKLFHWGYLAGYKEMAGVARNGNKGGWEGVVLCEDCNYGKWSYKGEGWKNRLLIIKILMRLQGWL